MITHAHSVNVTVADQDKALDFYVTTLGWEKSMDTQMGPGMRWITVAPAGAQTQVSLGQESWTGKPAGGETGISLYCDDMDATYADLSAKGVRFDNPPEQMPWGDKGTSLYDLDGNKFFIAGR